MFRFGPGGSLGYAFVESLPTTCTLYFCVRIPGGGLYSRRLSGVGTCAAKIAKIAKMVDKHRKARVEAYPYPLQCFTLL